MQGFFSRVSGFVDTRGATWHGVRHYDRIKQNRDLSLQVPSGSALGRLVDLFALSIWNKLMFSYVACWASKWPKQECSKHKKRINADDVPPFHKTHNLTEHKVWERAFIVWNNIAHWSSQWASKSSDQRS